LARFLALDWDHQQLHVVAASVGGGGVRIQRAVVWQEQQSPNPAEAEALGKLLRERLKTAGIALAPVLVCLGRDRVILKEVRYPDVPAAEEPAIVRFQAVKELTDPAEEVIIDYAPAGEPGPNGEKRAWALIVRRELLQTYQTLCKAAGLKLVGLAPRPFGTMSGLKRLVGTTVLTPAPEPPDAAMAVLTVTERWAEFCVLRGETLLFARSLAPGTTLAGEVRRNLAVYLGQAPQNPVRALYVAGGTEQAALRQRLQDMLAIPIHPFDPFGGVEKPELPAAHRGAFAGTVGLLYAQADKRGLPINFVRPKEPKPPRDPNQKRVLLGAGVAAALLVAAVAYCVSQVAAKDQDLNARAREKADLDRQLTQLDDDSKRIKALDDWSQTEIVWLDELYDLTARFPDPNKLFLMQMTGNPVSATTKSRDKYVGRMTLKGGMTLDPEPVDDLVADLARDGHYNVPAKQDARNTAVDTRRFPRQFTLTVGVEKLPPARFVRQLEVQPGEQRQPDRGGRGPGRGRGRFERGERGNMGFGNEFGGGQP
jgi:Tfp pilus assembly PilM family ATPase